MQHWIWERIVDLFYIGLTLAFGFALLMLLLGKEGRHKVWHG